MDVEVAVLGSPSLISLVVSVDVKKPWKKTGEKGTGAEFRSCFTKSRGGRPGLPVPNKPCGFCGRKKTWKKTGEKGTGAEFRSCFTKSRGGRPRLPVPNKPCGFCGRKEPLKKTEEEGNGAAAGHMAVPETLRQWHLPAPWGQQGICISTVARVFVTESTHKGTH